MADIKSDAQSVDDGLRGISAQLAAIADKLGGISDKLCRCCGGGTDRSNAAVFAQYSGKKNADGSCRLISYYAPLVSQAEADSVNALTYLGAVDSADYSNVSLLPFTLDGFAMPGIFPVDISVIESFPLTLLKSKEGKEWISLTPPSHSEDDFVKIDPAQLEAENANWCGLESRTCFNKVFSATIVNPADERWTDDLKNQAAFFTVRDSVNYDNFGSSAESYSPVAAVGRISANSPIEQLTWGDLITMFDNGVFYVYILDYSDSLMGKVFQ